MTDPIKLSSVDSTLLPDTITTAIFSKTVENSAVMNLARKIPLSITAASQIPVFGDIPQAAWVEEGKPKPAGGATATKKTMTGKKVAVLVPVSQEVAETNPVGLWDQLHIDIATAIARAFDFACIHGQSLSGSAGPFGDNFLVKTTNSVTLGTASSDDGGLYADLVTGEAKVDDDAGYDFTGFAADPRIRSMLKLSVDNQGHPLFVPSVIAGAGNLGTLDGFPVAYNRGVSGAMRRNAPPSRTVTDGVLTNSSTAFSSATLNLSQADVGRSITGTGIPDDTTIATVTSATAGTLSGAVGGSAGGTGKSFTVSGDADSLVRAIGGDWSQCAWGQGMEIRVKLSTEASYVDAQGEQHNAFQDNLVLLLAEAYYGFVVNDPTAFVKFMKSGS